MCFLLAYGRRIAFSPCLCSLYMGEMVCFVCGGCATVFYISYSVGSRGSFPGGEMIEE
jgi:hypothetical protein